MDWTVMLAAVLAAGLGAYLGAALLKPEWFS